MAKKRAKLTEHNLEAILENIDSNVEQVLEGHSSLSKTIEDFKHKTGQELQFVNFGLKTLSGGQKDLTTKMDRLEDKYDKNFEHALIYLSRIDDEVQSLKNVFFQKADVERLGRVEKEVAQIKLAIQKWQK